MITRAGPRAHPNAHRQARTPERTPMNPGDQVGDFELKDETGTPRRLSDLLANGPVVLFFYPIASSGGCTQEACHFRDLAADFAAAGAQPVGISGDSVLKQSVFATSHSLGYPLLSDEGHEVAKDFGAWRWWLPGGLHTRRQTFVIGQDRRIVAAFASESKFDAHADEALAAVKRHATG
jgi:peroxiredoxin Q/BCP